MAMGSDELSCPAIEYSHGDYGMYVMIWMVMNGKIISSLDFACHHLSTQQDVDEDDQELNTEPMAICKSSCEAIIRAHM